MRSYQMNIRKDALRELAMRRTQLVQALACPENSQVPHHTLGKTIFPPVRQPSMYGRGTRGEVHCNKAGGLVHHESAVERDFFRIMEWDYTVDTFAVQPFKVQYERPNGRASHYTPDCFAISDKFFVGSASKYEPTAFEIKTRDDLRADWAELKPKLRAGRSFLVESGFRFRILTEDRIHPIFLTNINFLLKFRGPRFLLRSRAEALIIDRLMRYVKRKNDDFTPRELLDQFTGPEPREQVIPWMWNLYADYVLQCDLLTPLTLDTVSWRCGDAGEGIQNCGFPDKRADWRQPENDWRR